MSTSLRFYFGGIRGRSLQSLTFGGVRPWSVVHVSASEATPWGSADYFPGHWNSQRFDLFVGAAPIWVTNVAPYHGGVRFMLHVDWRNILNVAVTVTLDDSIPIPVRLY